VTQGRRKLLSNGERDDAFFLDFRDTEAPEVEIDSLQQLYRQEIEQTTRELEAALTRLHQGVSEPLKVHLNETLSVLKSCFVRNTLSVPALDVMLQHLRALSALFNQKSN
jgi:hypothetical protein